jgi:hypothetical protein
MIIDAQKHKQSETMESLLAGLDRRCDVGRWSNGKEPSHCFGAPLNDLPEQLTAYCRDAQAFRVILCEIVIKNPESDQGIQKELVPHR